MEIKEIQYVTLFGASYSVTKGTSFADVEEDEAHNQIPVTVTPYTVSEARGKNPATNESWNTSEDIDIRVIEYADKAFSKCVVQIFAEAVHFSSLSVYPTVDENAKYFCSLNGQILSGKEIMENGIKISTGNYEGSSIVLIKKD